MKRKFLSVTIILSMLLLTLIPLSTSAAVVQYTYEDLTYTISNREITITNCNAYASEIEIPTTINSYPVTTIGSSAFKDCENLTTIIIPNSITKISNSAFENCSSLLEVNIPNSVTGTMGLYTFRNCVNLTSVTLSDNVTSIGDQTFEGCIKLSSVNFGSNLTSIELHAFNGCKNLTEVVLPNSVTYIGNHAFHGCSKLKNVYIPAGVTYIGDNAFIYCTSLTDINVNPYNNYYSSNDGNLFNKYQNTLIQYALGKTSKDYIVPNGVTKINDYAFDNCITLTTITIPKSLTTIGYNAFNWCSNIKTVNYEGYKKDWSNITINSGNTFLTKATINFLPISLSVEKNNNEFIVTPNGVENGNRVIFACYNGNKMVYVNPYIYAGETTIPFTTTETYDKVKVMVWENLETCVPLCEAENVPLN